MIKLVIIGTGNVALQLCRAFTQAGEVQVIQVVGRNSATLETFRKYTDTGAIKELRPNADVYIIAVSDDSISTVYQQLTAKEKLVVHTSGSVSIMRLAQFDRTGVFYPLQSFSPHRPINFKEVPICIEASSKEDLGILKNLASSISDHVMAMDSEKRRQLHLAAVFANNFTNHLYQISFEILKEAELPFEMLLPLIRESATKLEEIAPYDAQTGPARRQDTNTMQKHLELLKAKEHRDIYALLSTSIQQSYAKKL